MANSVMQNTQSNIGSSNNPMEMVQQIRQFGRTLQGNPKQQVMSMVQQGLRTNTQLQQAMNMAQQFRGMFK